MEKKELRIRHHDRTVYGIFYKPDGKKKFPLTIFSHGYNGHETDFEISAKYFDENGIGAICYTFCGGSTRCSSEFPTTEMTIFTEKEDLISIIDEVLKWDCIDKNNIFLFGGSMGGLVSALTAEERKQDIKSLILLYPALCIADNWNATYKKVADIPDVVDFWGMKLGRRFFETLRNYKVFENIGSFKRNVLIMSGTKDEVVPINYSLQAAKQYQNARMEIFENESHGFTNEGNRRMEAMALFFLHECMEEE